jgi:hypothetical protein
LNCPFCQNQVLPKAYVCGHCGRDLVPWLSLLVQLDQHHQKIERLEKALGLPADLSNPSRGEATSALPMAEPPPVMWHAQRLLVWALACAALLWLAHWLLLFVYDAPPLVLRLVTMAMPLLAALGLNARGDVDWRSNAITAWVLSTTGVAGMLAITAWLDDVALWPQTKRDWIETFEYTVSILLAWVTGHLVGLALNKGQRLLYERRRLMNNSLSTVAPRVTEVSEQLQKLAAAAAPVASGLIAAYSGLKSILGEG